MQILLFIILQLVNVILSTIKSICTIKCGKFIAALMNAVYFGFYTVIMIYTVNDDLIQSIFIKALITFCCNAIGVYFSKWLLEKMEKDKLWEIVATVPKDRFFQELHYNLNKNNIGNNYIALDNGDAIFHIYSKDKKDSQIIKTELTRFNAKYIVHAAEVQL